MEYQIGMTDGAVQLGVAFLMSPDYTTTEFWPEGLGAGCRTFSPVQDGLPQTVDFAPETWATIIAVDE